MLHVVPELLISLLSKYKAMIPLMTPPKLWLEPYWWAISKRLPDAPFKKQGPGIFAGKTTGSLKGIHQNWN